MDLADVALFAGLLAHVVFVFWGVVFGWQLLADRAASATDAEARAAVALRWSIRFSVPAGLSLGVGLAVFSAPLGLNWLLGSLLGIPTATIVAYSGLSMRWADWLAKQSGRGRLPA